MSSLSCCEAVNIREVRCKRMGVCPVEVDGRPVLLCRHHAEQARRGPIALWYPDQPAVPPDQRGVAWTAEEDAYLVAHADGQMAGVARHLGRTVEGVGRRRRRLDRRAEKDQP